MRRGPERCVYCGTLLPGFSACMFAIVQGYGHRPCETKADAQAAFLDQRHEEALAMDGVRR